MTAANNLNIGADLEFTKITRRAAARGTWVSGRVYRHKFKALVFPEHAENPEYELGDSRITRLWVQRLADRKIVFNWDRGPDIPAANKIVQAVVDLLCCGLADVLYTP